MKGEINPSCNNIPMIRFIVADDSGAMQGVAFSSVAEALFTQFEVNFFYAFIKTYQHISISTLSRLEKFTICLSKKLPGEINQQITLCNHVSKST